MAKVFASQEIYLVGRAVSGKIEDKEAKSGKKYTSYKMSMLTPEGVFVNMEKRIWEGQAVQDWMSKDLEAVTDMIGRINEPGYKEGDEHIYIAKSLKPGKKGMFDTLSTWKTDEGQLKISVDGYPYELETSKNDEDDVILHFTNRQTGETRTELFKDKKANIKFKMIVKEITEDVKDPKNTEVVLTDGKAEWATEVHLSLGEVADHNGRPTIGDAYEFHCELKRGARGAVEKGSAVWGEKKAKKQGNGETDRIWIVAVPATVPNLKAEFEIEGGASTGGTVGGAPAPSATPMF